VIIVLGSVLFGAAIEAVLVGLGLAALQPRVAFLARTHWRFAVSLSTLLVLSVYHLPAVAELDATITIGNQQIADMLGPGTPIQLDQLLGFDYSDLISCLVQSAIAMAVCRFLVPHPAAG
jgi:hypothetical protein